MVGRGPEQDLCGSGRREPPSTGLEEAGDGTHSEGADVGHFPAIHPQPKTHSLCVLESDSLWLQALSLAPHLLCGLR